MDPSPLATPVDTRGQAAVPAAVADYVVVRQLGEGNHGRYYLARPPARLELAEEFVALKVFGDRVGELAYERGVRELRAFAAVRSPYLVTVYDAVLEDTFAYAMQYFPLGSLSAPARPLARTEVHRALENAARAAHALHEAGMAHSDIKPANVLLTEGSGGSAAGIGGRLSDLGLARFLAPGATLTSMGRASSVEYVDPDVIGGRGRRGAPRSGRSAPPCTARWRAPASTASCPTPNRCWPSGRCSAPSRRSTRRCDPTRRSSCGSASPPTTAGCRPRRPWPTAWPRCAPDAGQAVPARLRIVTVPSLRFVT